jgi:hypothetical protein
MPTELDNNKDLIRRWIEFSNAGFAGRLDDFISPDYVGHLGATTMDRNELERLERRFSAAFPDARHDINDLIAEVIEWFSERPPMRHIVQISRASLGRIAPWNSPGSWCIGSKTARLRSRGARSTICD